MVDLTLALVGEGFVVEVGVAGRELGEVLQLFHVFLFLGDFNQCLLIAFFISEH